MFELSVPEFKLVKQCRREVKMLKQLWDYMFLVRTCIDDWRTSMWVDIDVENMDMECKKFAKVNFCSLIDVHLIGTSLVTIECFIMKMISGYSCFGQRYAIMGCLSWIGVNSEKYVDIASSGRRATKSIHPRQALGAARDRYTCHIHYER